MAGVRPQRAILSVADKRGITDLARTLSACGIEIISTGGTQQELTQAGITTTAISELTGRTQALDGRVKTLGQAVLGGILFDRDIDTQHQELEQLGAVPIDLVVVNFYPFSDGVKAGKAEEDLVELIDIGGPTMVRAAAKNHRHVVVVTDPNDYEKVSEQLQKNQAITAELRQQLASKAFRTTSSYDAEIAASFTNVKNTIQPTPMLSSLLNLEQLSYGENPHQAGWVGNKPQQLGGPQLSYNNLQDAIAAWRCVSSFTQPACAIIKHTNPCGVAVAQDIAAAYTNAFQADTVSAYGGVVACNQEIDLTTLEQILKVFCEVIIAPGFSEEASQRLSTTKRVKSLQAPFANTGTDAKLFGEIALVQRQDHEDIGQLTTKQVSTTAPTKQQEQDLLFAWQVAMHARSNAIVLAKDGTTIGIGAGQTSRVEAAQLALDRATAKGFTPHNAVVASDAFFPFADGVELLAQAKVAAIIAPGGSKRDPEVIAAANQAGIALVFTDKRHFVH